MHSDRAKGLSLSELVPSNCSVTSIASLRVNASELGQLVAGLREQLRGEPKLVLAMASPTVPLKEALGTLKSGFPDAVVVGATTSGEFTEHGDGTATVAVFALAGDYAVFAGVGEGLSVNAEQAVLAALAGQPAELEGYPHRTAILLIDALAGFGEEAALLLATFLGDSPLVGGAAGDDLAMKSTSVGTADTVASDALMVATIFSRAPLGVGVKHGHQSLSPQSYRVTRADGPVVLEVDGRPAWDVWLEAAGPRARATGLDPEGKPGAFLLRFEAGLRVGHEFKVRAPLAPKPGGGILFATPVDEGTVFQIMESDASAQVESALEAARLAKQAMGGGEVAGALVFDCICRKLILGDDYSPMVKQVSDALGGVRLAGFATYGEIAMNSGDMSGFHNTTTVVLTFPS
jgi:methyl-accepting chemotaxis protein